jgi:hypothetical protein
MEPIITTLLTLGAAGAGAAGVRYLWRLASGGATEHERLQAQVLIEHARHQHPLPPQSYAPHIPLTHNPQYAPRITRSSTAPVPPLVEDTPAADDLAFPVRPCRRLKLVNQAIDGKPKHDLLLISDGGYLSGVDINRTLHNLRRKGMVVRLEDVATLSPYLTQHINRVG